MSISVSQFIPLLPFPPGNHVCFLHLWHYLFRKFTCIIFLDSTCKWISFDICLSLPDLTSLSIRISRFVHVAANGIVLFYLMANIPLSCLWWLSGKESTCNAGDTGLTPGLGKSPGEGNNFPLQYSCLRNPMGRGAWWATVRGVTKESDTTSWRTSNNNVSLDISATASPSIHLLMDIEAVFVSWILWTMLQRILSLSVLHKWQLLRCTLPPPLFRSSRQCRQCPFSQLLCLSCRCPSIPHQWSLKRFPVSCCLESPCVYVISSCAKSVG